MDPSFFIFMPFAENGDLFDFIMRHGAIPEQQSKLWFRQMASGLQYLHSQNIAHRDLKCENILISRRLDVKLADFGFARFCADSDGRQVLSRTYCGSPAYEAPEILSQTPYNPKLADICSLGVILFMVNASMPFSHSNLAALYKDQMSMKWAFHPSVRRIVSTSAKSVVARMLQPQPHLRNILNTLLTHKWLSPNKNKSAFGITCPSSNPSAANCYRRTKSLSY